MSRVEYNREYYRKNRTKMLERAREWRQANPGRHRQNMHEWRKKNRDRHLELCRNWYRKWYTSKTYGVPPNWYANKLEEQDGLCAICLKSATKRKFVVDHNHSTGEARGLLCDPCNMALSRIEAIDNWDVKARDYLLRYGGAR
jgi:hypothetical protein